MRATRTTLAAAVTVAALALGGCAAGGGSSGADAGGTLVYATAEPDHLTPGRQTVAFTQVMSLFAPLVSVDADNAVTYVQAESVESDDATTWTIVLRDGWTFQDGTPVTAQSYVDAWNYTADAANAFENSGQLAGIAGYDDLNPAEGDPTASTMSGLSVVDDTTFQVQLSHADSQFPLQLSQAQTGFYPMPESAYDDMEAYDRQPVGNGPFEMTEPWVDDAEFTVSKYDGYQGDDAAQVDDITYRSYSDQNTAYTDVLAGNADVLFLPASKMTSAEADFGDRLYSFDAPGIDYLGFPLTDERYSDVRVRQAISMSIDRDAVNTAIYGGLYEPATAFTPSAMDGTPEGLCGEFCEFDPDAAQALLEEAGGFDGTMEIVYPGGSGLDSLFEAYANQIRQNLGVEDVVAKPSTDWAEYYQGLVDRTTSGPHFGHWGALYVSQQNTLRSLFTEAGGCYDCTWYSSPEVDALLDEADQAATPEAATDAYRAVQEEVLADFPVAPTFSDKYSYVTSEKVATLPQAAGSPIVQGITLK